MCRNIYIVSNDCISIYNGCETLPQKVICEKCGHVLYEGSDLKPPDEIIQANDGKCPKCSKKISFVPIKVVVKPAQDTARRR